MILTTSHKNPEISKEIMKFLYENFDIVGNEEHLVNELLIDIIGQSQIWRLENELSNIHDENIDLPKNLKLIESYERQL